MKIEIRKNCKVCGDLITKKRFRTFCSKKCRNKNNNTKRRNSYTEEDRKKMSLIAERKWQEKLMNDPREKIQCLICGKWYIQVGSHIIQKHKITAREYREYFDLEVKRGITPKWYRKKKGDQALKNKTYKNLEVGKKFWFKKGDRSLGRYKRSHITMKRLSILYKLNKGRNKK